MTLGTVWIAAREHNIFVIAAKTQRAAEFFCEQHNSVLGGARLEWDRQPDFSGAPGYQVWESVVYESTGS